MGRSLAGAASDLKHAGSLPEPRDIGKVGEQRPGIAGAHPLVQLGVRIESLP